MDYQELLEYGIPKKENARTGSEMEAKTAKDKVKKMKIAEDAKTCKRITDFFRGPKKN
jgi:hypothetical protein